MYSFNLVNTGVLSVFHAEKQLRFTLSQMPVKKRENKKMERLKIK
jgi:hypothetical protein